MLKGAKHCWNLHESTFIILFWVGQCLSSWYLTSEDCLLTHWLPITSILFLIRTIYGKQFKFNYLRIKNFYTNFSAFLKFTSNFEYFEKKRWLASLIYLWKTWWIKCLTNPVLEHALTVNTLKGPKHCPNLHDRALIIFFLTLKDIE